ncbi:MAG: ABC transporter substrate-binding protein [Bacillota bacterium]|nr:ABC transporter substrate-binding protein [Bacillota bacterium]
MSARVMSLLGVLLSVALAVTAVGGCAGGQAPEQAKEKVVVLAYSEGGQTLDPSLANDLTSDTMVLACYDQLVTYGKKDLPDGRQAGATDKIQPMLAEKWDVSPDGKTYTFHLRKGVKFHSGNPLDAEAVKFSFERVAKTGAGQFLVNTASIDMSQFKVLDPNTVQITLTRPNPLFLQIIAMYVFSIADPKVVQEKGDKWLASNTAGSGPFKLESWNPASEAVLVANKDYWEGRPKVDRIIMKFIAEASNRIMMLKNGDVDLAVEIPPKDAVELRSAQGVKVHSDPSVRILYFGMNHSVKPFDNVKVRQAISYAVPYEDLIQKVMYGQAKQLKSPCPSGMPMSYPDAWNYRHDLEEARRLLKEAGYEKGFEFDFTLGSGFADWEEDAVLIQAELAKIGVKMNIQRTARAQFLELMRQRKLTAYISKWTSFVNDPGYHLGFLLYGKGSSNYIGYSNPRVDELLEKAMAETDPARRAPLYREAQEIIVREAPWVFLYEYARIVGVRDNVTGYMFYPDELIRFYPLDKK